MSWPVQIKEVFDVLQSSPDSILDPADPEIKMHLLRTNLVNSAFWTWQQIKKPDLTQKNFDWPIWEPPYHLKVLPPSYSAHCCKLSIIFEESSNKLSVPSEVLWSWDASPWWFATVLSLCCTMYIIRTWTVLSLVCRLHVLCVLCKVHGQYCH